MMEPGTRWLLAAGLMALIASPATAQTYSPRNGERHVSFTLPTIDDGRPVSLEQFRGKKVLLIQFASW